MQNEESALDENFKIESEDTLLGVKTDESIDVMFYTPLVS